MPEIAEILRDHLDALDASFDGRLPLHLQRVVLDLIRCRTPALGGSLYACDDAQCGALDYAYHSCRNRHCPKCHGTQTDEWLAKLEAILPPCRYLLVTFTLPERLRGLARREPRLVYDLMMRLAARCVVDLARDPEWIGGTPGILSVLHTWSRTMAFHPHVHLLVTAGGMADGEDTWIHPRNRRFVMPGRVLSELFRKRLLRELALRDLLRHLPPPPRRKDRWVVHVKRAGDGRQVLRYLARYVYRVAIANASILAADERRVVFRYRDTRTQTLRTLALDPVAFLRRFLQHALPRAFVKIRYCGILAPACRQRLAVARRLLEREAGVETAPAVAQTGAGTELPAESSAEPETEPRLCRVCGRGHLQRRRALPRDLFWLLRPRERAPP